MSNGVILLSNAVDFLLNGVCYLPVSSVAMDLVTCGRNTDIRACD